MTSVTIPNSVTFIGPIAFALCRGLTSVTIPESVTAIEEGAFEQCTGLTEIINLAATPQSVTNFYSFNGVNKSTCILRVPAASVNAYRAANIWKDFENIVAIDGGSDCPTWNQLGFTWTICPAIDWGYYPTITVDGSGTLPNNGFVNGGAPLWLSSDIERFAGAGNLIVNEGVTGIGIGTFAYFDALSYISIPSSVSQIGEKAFADITGSGWSNAVYNYATTPQQINANVFPEAYLPVCTLHVAVSAVNAYRAANVWKDFGSIETIDGSESPLRDCRWRAGEIQLCCRCGNHPCLRALPPLAKKLS